MDRLRLSGLAIVLSAFGAGLGATWMWMQSNAQWTAHLNRAYVAGAALYDGLRLGDPVGDGFVMAPLPAAEQFLATKGDFDHLSNSPRPALITYVSIYAQPSDLAAGDHLTLAVLSADLQYPLADLHSGTAQPAWEVFAALSRTLASYCSEPVVIARMQDQPWVRITGPDVWDCTAAPADRRLAAAILGLAALGILATLVLDASARFTQFADALRSRRRLGGPGQYVAKGPKELRDIVSAVNGYLELEREQLAKRAIVLSGVSHDLGTPATRLKLRSALISDPALKTKIEADIDRMTGIIESVLTYTRTEMDTEAPRRLSLTSLIDAIVADYQDTGQPVEFRPQEVVMVEGGRSLFMSKRGHSHVPDQGRIIVTADRSLCNVPCQT